MIYPANAYIVECDGCDTKALLYCRLDRPPDLPEDWDIAKPLGASHYLHLCPVCAQKPREAPDR